MCGGRDNIASSTLLRVRVKSKMLQHSTVRAWSLGSDPAPDSEFATYMLFALGKVLKLLKYLSLSFLIFNMRIIIISTIMWSIK